MYRYTSNSSFQMKQLHVIICGGFFVTPVDAPRISFKLFVEGASNLKRKMLQFLLI